MAKHIGEMIEDEVRRQKLAITDFANEIHTTRENVYNIFKRSELDIARLILISRVLNRNFIREIYLDPSIVDIDNPSVLKQLEEEKALMQFLSVIPKVMDNLGMQSFIVLMGNAFNKDDIDSFLPDFGLSEYSICFYKHAKAGMFETFDYEEISDGSKNHFRLCTNKLYGTKYAEVIIEYKTQLEWENFLRFIFQECVKRGVDLRTSGFTNR